MRHFLEENDLSDFMAVCGLLDLHSAHSPQSTFLGAAMSYRLHLGCDEALQYVLRAGTLAYTEGPQSGHRSLFVDLSPEFITPPPWSQINSPASQALHTGNPELVEKYNSTLTQYYEEHRMVARIDDLYNKRYVLSREEICQALIKCGTTIRTGQWNTVNDYRPIHKCSCSPILCNSAITRRYWLLCLRGLLHGGDNSSTFHRWQRQIQCHDPQVSLPSLEDHRMTIDQVSSALNQATTWSRKLQRQSTPLRYQCYEDLLEQYRDDTDPSTIAESRRKATIVQYTITGETTRQVFGHLRRIVKPFESSSLSKLLVSSESVSDGAYFSYQITQTQDPSSILWETIVSREEMERHILEYIRDSFRAAAESPCGHGVVHDALSCTGLSPESASILSGIISPELCGNDEYLRVLLAPFTIPPHVKLHSELTWEISSDDVIGCFKGWKESTSTSPSGRPLGHYKALAQLTVLLHCFVQFMSIVVAQGIAIPRWCNATNVMIEKDPGKPCIHRLRIIHLFEADYNSFLKLQCGHRLVRHAMSLDLLHDSQHGSKTISVVHSSTGVRVLYLSFRPSPCQTKSRSIIQSFLGQSRLEATTSAFS
jgi:hypothetical protein